MKFRFFVQSLALLIFGALFCSLSIAQFNFFECAKNPNNCKIIDKPSADKTTPTPATGSSAQSATRQTKIEVSNLPEPTALAKPIIYANRKALVIGNDQYKNVSELKNAVSDAKSIADGLTQVGYLVTLKTNLDDKGMKLALRNFKLQVDPGDEVAFFYAGHGVQFGQSNYLLPIDIIGDNEDQVKDESMPLERLLNDMAERRAKFTLAMIDACRDNPFKSAGRSLSISRGLAPTTAATGQMIVFSAGNGQQALDSLGASDPVKNGLFTRIFVKEMQKPGLSINNIVRNVRTQVAELAKSVGRDQVPSIYDQVIGEFYFK